MTNKKNEFQKARAFYIHDDLFDFFKKKSKELEISETSLIRYTLLTLFRGKQKKWSNFKIDHGGPKTLISVRMSDELYDYYKMIADEKNLNVSKIFRVALNQNAEKIIEKLA